MAGAETAEDRREQELRRRTSAAKGPTAISSSGEDASTQHAKPTSREEPAPALGKTPDGTLFRIPRTHNVLSSLFDPRLPKSHVDVVTLTLLASQVVLFCTLPHRVAQPFFLAYFAAWRLLYNVGLGVILRKQSEKRWIVRLVQRKGWMDPERRPLVHRWVSNELYSKMGSDYKFEAVPVEYNVWIMFRHFVDVVLLNDFLSYFFMAMTFADFPGPVGHSPQLHALRWLGGAILILFNLWVKVDAHRIVKDFAWYWGDAFFLSLQSLVFDGVFEFAPHPMYSVGYAGYYGLSLITASEAVLLVSLAAHALQFGFLCYFENPHIERTYGEAKPLAARVPLEGMRRLPRQASSGESETEGESQPSTPSLSDGNTSDSDSNSDSESSQARPSKRRAAPSSRHDLDYRYFGQDLLVLKNFDVFRASDICFALLIAYALTLLVPAKLSPAWELGAITIHALLWRVFHTVGLGMLLKAQSEKRWLVRHFLKHYHYSKPGEARDQAWREWKRVYNLSLAMTYVSFGAVAWRCYTLPRQWSVGAPIARHALGSMLIALHIWTAHSTYEALGPFGWFYGDFFIEDYPTELYYTGIFRFLNNPERLMGGAAFFGAALICGSKLLLGLAVFAVVAHWWFLSAVENPHMKRLYGAAIRRDAGVTKTLRKVATQNARVFGGVTKGVIEVQDTVERVFGDTADVVEGFFVRSAPRLHEYVEDTRSILKRSGERIVISRSAPDLHRVDVSLYSLRLSSSLDRDANLAPPQRAFLLGEPVRVAWSAPASHSEEDWVGLYRVGANSNPLVTKISSQGRWLGVDASQDHVDHDGTRQCAGVLIFSGKVLSWEVGKYELRYHHDGKHDVLAVAGPFDIHVPAFTGDSVDLPSVHRHLRPLVLCILGEDTDEEACNAHSASYEERRTSYDDFVVPTLDDAEHIAYAIRMAYNVDLTKEVIIAAANIRKLSKQIVESKRIMT